ncbi:MULTISPECIES: HpcH/HpaI aldolase family protein [Pseudonocardia]|uniref:2-keto-3-deoxy-L-rhamnonate aldolase n=2 Tax=Pseudonocardia TaxID=1847 RepID=A0A1Y2MZI9_PSEAH|nr:MULTISPECIES: aldolase/citrate lyase family protein [Pseudonocardia]OSY40389.1 2-keto-3-deoxy-L-rhamnonate aldolase [Pseudonocardia autotrophica]TDN72280.1 4-hydroxy-2-oxoheptanedioate aldolase [Pseudonocardia autotrophica]BBG02992.1 hypothetical protein Pdca_42010 [Pseudonocardia autotrophica]GEC25106.1 hypothetical protein PSA01_21350 [Pseudonocardia saturnea]
MSAPRALHRSGAVADGPAWGTWIKLPGPESTEIMAAAGFDFCVIDTEHTLLDPSQVYNHIVVGSGLGMRMLVRVAEARPAVVARLLDAGADGVVAPHVDDAAAAGALAAATRFPPDGGTRGSGATSRAGGWGSRPRSEYLAGRSLAVAQIESAAAVRDIDAICAAGPGAVLVGPADLGLDLARDGGAGSVEELAGTVRAAAGRAGLLVGTACGADRAAAVARQGYDFVVCGNDATFMADAARAALTAARDAGSGARTPGGEEAFAWQNR